MGMHDTASQARTDRWGPLRASQNSQRGRCEVPPAGCPGRGLPPVDPDPALLIRPGGELAHGQPERDVDGRAKRAQVCPCQGPGVHRPLTP
jgi:hypothetical protein